MIELAGDMTHKSKRKRITPRDISLVIKNDEELVSISLLFFSKMFLFLNESLGEIVFQCNHSRRWCSTIYSSG
jgi:hypothetical protein